MLTEIDIYIRSVGIRPNRSLVFAFYPPPSSDKVDSFACTCPDSLFKDESRKVQANAKLAQALCIRIYQTRRSHIVLHKFLPGTKHFILMFVLRFFSMEYGFILHCFGARFVFALFLYRAHRKRFSK